MRLLLTALIFFLTLSSVFAWDPGPAPGVKIKNVILYLLAIGLLFNFTIERKFKLELTPIQITFVVMIGYCILSYLAVVLFADYPRYDWLTSGFDLKNRPIDQMLFFLVFFYGVRTQKDAMFLLQCLVFSWVLSHAVAILDATGYVHIGDIDQRGDGRVQGAVGESNQYGAFVVLTLPAALAAAIASRGLWRWFWAGGAALTGITLIMTVSRGAFVATVFAALAGAYIFRRYLSVGRIFTWMVGAAAAGVVLLVVVIGAGFGDLLYDRLITSVSSKDLGGTSSGRTEIWATAFEVMMESPVTLLTGFGWNAYWAMPFRFSPHNYYLAQWFNLGLPGLICSILLLVLPARVARQAAMIAAPNVRPLLIGFVLSTLAFAIATFFVDLYVPWLYFWAYAGLTMRLAMIARHDAHAPVAVESPAAAPSARRADRYGWISAAPR